MLLTEGFILEILTLK